MDGVFDVLLLLALPASGKSEVRKYLEERNPEQFHMGPTVQIDDYPYVHLQLVIDEELKKLGQPRAFHHDDPAGGRNGPFKDAAELGALGRLLNDDFAELCSGKAERPEKAALHLFQRMDAASEAAGGKAKLMSLPPDVLEKVAAAMEDEIREHYDAMAANVPASLDGKTVVVEFARGGPKPEAMPLAPGYGYRGTVSQLSSELLRRSAVLYIWVDPEETRRKNRERARPDGEASILFHGVPESVLDQEYAACDMAHLMETSDVPGTIQIEHHSGEVFHLPAARFDNRADLTTFLREDPSTWKEADVEALQSEIKPACDRLWATLEAQKK
ncbi:MAG: hypothetical protein JRI68_24630 [Deltaproteobacteria bacterium]|nr:hypothetical protein [Deltaproteobacteria bacterium]